MSPLRPDIETLVNTLMRRESRYIPLAELGIAPSIKEKFIGRPVRSVKDDIEFWYRAGYDYIKLQPSVRYLIGGKTTELGDDATREWAAESDGLIKTWQDFNNYPFPEPEDVSYERFDQARNHLPDGLGIIGQYGDIFTLSWELMGLENFSFALFENPDLVKAVVDKVGFTILSMFEVMAQDEDIQILWYSDDIAFNTGLLMSPDVLKIYFFPWLKAIGKLAKESGKPLIYHSDGLLNNVLEDIIKCGVDALHPIEPKAMDIREVRLQVGQRLALIGNIDVGDILTRGTPERIREQVRQNIEWMDSYPGYCIGSGNSIPEYIPIENYKAMLDAAIEYGGGR